MQAVFIGGPRHREEETVLFNGTMSIGEYDRVAASSTRPAGGDWDVDLAYFVFRGMDDEKSRISINKHLRDEPEPVAP